MSIVDKFCFRTSAAFIASLADGGIVCTSLDVSSLDSISGLSCSCSIISFSLSNPAISTSSSTVTYSSTDGH